MFKQKFQFLYENHHHDLFYKILKASKIFISNRQQAGETIIFRDKIDINYTHVNKQ